MLHNTQIKTNYFKQFRPLNFIQTLQVSPIDKQKQETTNPGRLLLPMTSFPLVPPETLDRHTCRRYRAIQSYKKFDYNNIAGKSSDFLCFHWEIANLLYTHTTTCVNKKPSCCWDSRSYCGNGIHVRVTQSVHLHNNTLPCS